MEISEQSFMNSETIFYRDASNRNTREKLMLKYKLKAKAQNNQKFQSLFNAVTLAKCNN